MPEKSVELLASFPVEIADVQDARPPHVLICVHGIRDDGAWCNTATTALGEFLDTRIEIVCVRYDRVSSHGFLLGRNRSATRADVLQQIRYIASRFPESPMSVLCHSNGTKIIAELMGKFGFKFEWIFLLGSVCHIRDVDKLREIVKHPVNDAGTRDWWPIIAEATRPSMFGATGTCGFSRYPVVDRYFNYSHGGGITQDHINGWILPTLSTGSVRRSPHQPVKFKKHLAAYIRYAFLIIVLYCCFRLV
jgi:hypothetical protein